MPTSIVPTPTTRRAWRGKQGARGSSQDTARGPMTALDFHGKEGVDGSSPSEGRPRRPERGRWRRSARACRSRRRRRTPSWSPAARRSAPKSLGQGHQLERVAAAGPRAEPAQALQVQPHQLVLRILVEHRGDVCRGAGRRDLRAASRRQDQHRGRPLPQAPPRTPRLAPAPAALTDGRLDLGAAKAFFRAGRADTTEMRNHRLRPW
jgi:hypothetical protein